MKVVTELSLALCCGFLGAGVSAWNAKAPHEAHIERQFSGFLTASQWKEATRRAESLGLAVLVYVGMAGTAPLGLQDDLEHDTVLKEALRGFVCVTVFLDGDSDDQALALELGVTAAPDFIVIDLADGAQGRTRLSTVTGSTFERFGLVAELTRIRQRTAPAGPTAGTEPKGEDEPGINGFRERYAQLQGVVEAFTVPVPGDVETVLDLHLATEGNERLCYYGWSWLSSWLEQCARRAAVSGGEYLGVPRARWESRLRGTSRRAWISCPKNRLLPFGCLLLQRYARARKDLDSLDRAFVSAVLRTLAEAPALEALPREEWLNEARRTHSSK